MKLASAAKPTNVQGPTAQDYQALDRIGESSDQAMADADAQRQRQLNVRDGARTATFRQEVIENQRTATPVL